MSNTFTQFSNINANHGIGSYFSQQQQQQQQQHQLQQHLQQQQQQQQLLRTTVPATINRQQQMQAAFATANMSARQMDYHHSYTSANNYDARLHMSNANTYPYNYGTNTAQYANNPYLTQPYQQHAQQYDSSNYNVALVNSNNAVMQAAILQKRNRLMQYQQQLQQQQQQQQQQHQQQLQNEQQHLQNLCYSAEQQMMPTSVLHYTPRSNNCYYPHTQVTSTVTSANMTQPAALQFPQQQPLQLPQHDVDYRNGFFQPQMQPPPQPPPPQPTNYMNMHFNSQQHLHNNFAAYNMREQYAMQSQSQQQQQQQLYQQEQQQPQQQQLQHEHSLEQLEEQQHEQQQAHEEEEESSARLTLNQLLPSENDLLPLNTPPSQEEPDDAASLVAESNATELPISDDTWDQLDSSILSLKDENACLDALVNATMSPPVVGPYGTVDCATISPPLPSVNGTDSGFSTCSMRPPSESPPVYGNDCPMSVSSTSSSILQPCMESPEMENTGITTANTNHQNNTNNVEKQQELETLTETPEAQALQESMPHLSPTEHEQQPMQLELEEFAAIEQTKIKKEILENDEADDDFELLPLVDVKIKKDCIHAEENDVKNSMESACLQEHMNSKNDKDEEDNNQTKSEKISLNAKNDDQNRDQSTAVAVSPAQEQTAEEKTQTKQQQDDGEHEVKLETEHEQETTDMTLHIAEPEADLEPDEETKIFFPVLSPNNSQNEWSRNETETVSSTSIAGNSQCNRLHEQSPSPVSDDIAADTDKLEKMDIEKDKDDDWSCTATVSEELPSIDKSHSPWNFDEEKSQEEEKPSSTAIDDANSILESTKQSLEEKIDEEPISSTEQLQKPNDNDDADVDEAIPNKRAKKDAEIIIDNARCAEKAAQSRLPGFLQTFGSTEIGRFSENFLLTPDSSMDDNNTFVGSPSSNTNMRNAAMENSRTRTRNQSLRWNNSAFNRATAGSMNYPYQRGQNVRENRRVGRFNEIRCSGY